ncbi:MAG: YfcE family phosphodiesterase [Promethearchaeota archaeon]
MIKILVIGDSHIPRRASEVPPEIYEKLTELGKYDYTFFTGDLIQAPKFLRFLKEKTNQHVFRVLGNMDYYNGITDLPIFQELEIPISEGDNLRIGLTHGAQINPRGDIGQIDALARKKRFDIIIVGHTHKEEICIMLSGRLMLNPGSVTGAWSFLATGTPSFIIMEIEPEKNVINTYLIRLNKKTKAFEETHYQFQFMKNKFQKIS